MIYYLEFFFFNFLRVLKKRKNFMLKYDICILFIKWKEVIYMVIEIIVMDLILCFVLNNGLDKNGKIVFKNK